MRINPAGGSERGLQTCPRDLLGVCGGVNTKTGCRVHTGRMPRVHSPALLSYYDFVGGLLILPVQTTYRLQGCFIYDCRLVNNLRQCIQSRGVVIESQREIPKLKGAEGCEVSQLIECEGCRIIKDWGGQSTSFRSITPDNYLCIYLFYVVIREKNLFLSFQIIVEFSMLVCWPVKGIQVAL